MGKICIVVNGKRKQYIAERVQALYPAGEEFYTLEFVPGFSKQIQPGTTEIVLGGGTAVRLRTPTPLRDEMFSFVTKNKLPMIGICFGAQLIARAYGGAIVQLHAVRAGRKPVRIIRDKQDFGSKYIAQIYKNQKWSLQDLPEDFVIYGVSSDGIEMFAHKTLPVAGVQFHPEQFTQITDGPQIYANLRQKILAQAKHA